MYLNGSKWSTKKRRRRSNPFRILVLVLLIGALIYVERVVVPTVPPLFVVTPTPTRSPASYVLEGESLFSAGKLSQAESSYQKAVTIDPDNPDYYIELARLQVFRGKYDEAVTNASNALLLEPNSARAYAVLGWAMDFQAQEDPEGEGLVDALANVQKALELSPNSALAHAYFAEVLIDSDIELYAEARQAAERAVELDPNLVEAHRALGYVWERTGNYDLAFESYETALRVNPNLAMLHIAMGNMYFNQGETNQAIESYLKATTLAPEDVVPLRLIARAYAREGEFGKASQYAKNAVDREPSNPRLHGDLGRMYYKAGDYESAIQELSLAIQGGVTEEGESVEGIPLDPGDTIVLEFYYMYGLALAKQGECSLATDIAEALLTGVPEDEIAVFNAQEILILCGELEPRPTPTGEGG